MKLTISIVLSFTFLTTTGQFAKLIPENPGPRQEEEFDIIIVLDNNDLEHLKNNRDQKGKYYDSLVRNNYAMGNLKIQQTPSDTGEFSIGPFLFSINQKNYQTEQLTLRIDPKLPGNVREGVWVRHVKLAHKNYLVIEQRIPITQQFEPGKYPNPLIEVNKGVIFMEPDIFRIRELGIDVISNTPMTTLQRVERKKRPDSPLSDYVSYKRVVLQFNFNTSRPVRITKNLFKNLPPTGFFEEIAIINH